MSHVTWSADLARAHHTLIAYTNSAGQCVPCGLYRFVNLDEWAD